MPNITPEEFRDLWWKQKIILLTRLYIGKCLDVHGKEYQPTFWKIKKHFEQQEHTQLHTLYDYLFQYEVENPKKILTLTEFYHGSNKYMLESRFKTGEKEKETHTEYKEFALEDLDDL